MQKHKKENYFYKDNFEALLHDFENGKQMVFFLGAGINISGDNGMDWNSLLDSLFIEAVTFLSIEKNFSAETQLTIDKAFKVPEFPKIKKQDNNGEEPQPKNDNKLELEKHIQFIKEAEQWSKLHKLAKNEFTPLVKASIIKEILGDNYITSIQNYLYSKCNKEKLKKAFEEDYVITKVNSYPLPGKYYSLYQLARLIILSQNVRAVVTYNFDNLLTEAINILREDQNRYFTTRERECIKERIPKDISNSSNEELSKESFPIYHIHGYIPPPTEIYLDKKNEIVLSMEEFYDNFGNLLSWQTSGQLHFLSNYTCIFTGLSLSDITTQRMIHTAHEQNKSRRIYYLSAANLDKKDDENFSNAYLSLMNIKNSFHANYGLSPIYEKNGYNKLFERFNLVFEKIVENKNEKNKNE